MCNKTTGYTITVPSMSLTPCDIDNIYNTVHNHIDKHVSTPSKGGNKPIMLLDIDDTSLITTVSTSHLYRQGVTYRLYRHALDRGMSVVFLTARRDSCYSYLWTLHQLYALGYTNVCKLILMPRAYKSASAFKAHIRNKLGRTNIIVNMGDQWGDLFYPVHKHLCPRNDVFIFTKMPQTQTINVKLPSP